MIAMAEPIDQPDSRVSPYLDAEHEIYHSSKRGLYRGPRCDKCMDELEVTHTGEWNGAQRTRRYRCIRCSRIKFLIEFDPERKLHDGVDV